MAFGRTNADKEQAVTRLLMDNRMGEVSDREIARRCNVGADIVGRSSGATEAARAYCRPRQYEFAIPY